MGTVDWDNVDPRPEGAGSGNGRSRFLKLEANKEYKIRPVGKPYEVRRYFVRGEGGKFNVAVTDAGDDCVILRNYKNADGEPEYQQRVRYALNCLDRNDTDPDTGLPRLKIIEVPVTVARFIRDWGKEMGVNPGSGKGADFKIKVVLKGDDRRNTRYETFPLAQTAFTDEEKAFLKEHGAYDLEEQFAPTPQSEIEEKLGLSGGGSTVTAGASSGSSSSSDDDDLDF